MKRDFVDFSHVPEHQLAIHARLENWGLTCRDPKKRRTSPGFELYQAEKGNTWMTLEPKTIPDQQDARKIARGVADLPTRHRLAVCWYYIDGSHVMRARKKIGATSDELQALVTDGRQMLMNRGV